MKVLRRPIQHIYPLEVRSMPQAEETPSLNLDYNSAVKQGAAPNTGEGEASNSAAPDDDHGRPKRVAAANAREIVRVLMEDN